MHVLSDEMQYNKPDETAAFVLFSRSPHADYRKRARKIT